MHGLHQGRNGVYRSGVGILKQYTEEQFKLVAMRSLREAGWEDAGNAPKGKKNTAEEVRTIMAFAECYKHKRHGVAVLALLYTGLRRGELLGLRWDDLSEDFIFVRRGVFLENDMPKVTEYQAKTAGSIRSVPLIPYLREQLERLPKTGRYIFGATNGGIQHPRNFNRAYYEFFDRLKEQEQEFKVLSPHCCRHTYATLGLSGGMGLHTMQLLLGHSDPKTTARYLHPDMQSLHTAVIGMYNTVNPPPEQKQ